MIMDRLIDQDRKKLSEIKKKVKENNIKVNSAKSNIVKAEKKNVGVKAPVSIEEPVSGGGAFAQMRGRLAWPLSGKIVRRFGENRNAKLNTVTINNGIDISSQPRQKVSAVAEGVVSTVNYLPGYGSVLIISHKDKFRTVYGHLGEIYVKDGARVSKGTVIGKVSESLEGNILHFELWNERKIQNPESWLRR
jgi:septal ring factor EnvC (AmiA/AmiB activator)